MNNAEIHGHYDTLSVYSSGRNPSGLLVQENAYNKWLKITVRPEKFSLCTDANGFSYQNEDSLLYLSDNNDWYIGVNRVIETHDDYFVSGSRTGSGLCSVCVRWLQGSTQETACPTPPPTPPTTVNPSGPPPAPECTMDDCFMCCKSFAAILVLSRPINPAH